MNTIWETYAPVHLSVLPSALHAVYLEVGHYAQGHVIDFGCGSGRMASLLSGNEAVESYTGIDASPEMIQVAQNLLKELDVPVFSVLETRIETFTSSGFDSGLSINSYYAWTDPVRVLKHIHSRLKPSASFVLVTPNASLNMPRLLMQADRELTGHPDYKTFKQLNLQLANQYPTRFVDMDELVHQARTAGFTLQSCHTQLYHGGLNFVHLQAAV